jgi:hypothetical protein
MESSLIRMVAVPLIAGRNRPCLLELRSYERTSLPLTPIDASPPAGLTLDRRSALFYSHSPSCRITQPNPACGCKNAETAAVVPHRGRPAPEGAKGALLRREGLYSSHIVEWRKARDAGALAGLAVPARPQARRDPQAEKIARLVAEKRQLEQELAKARFVVDVQAKLRTPSRGRRHDRPGRRPTRRAHRRAVCVRRRKRRCSAKHR